MNAYNHHKNPVLCRVQFIKQVAVLNSESQKQSRPGLNTPLVLPFTKIHVTLQL